MQDQSNRRARPCSRGCGRSSRSPDGGLCGSCFTAASVDARRERGELGRRPCDVEGCREPCHSRRMCMRHYRRWKVWGDPWHGDDGDGRRVESRQCASPGCGNLAADADRWCVACELAGKPWQQCRRPSAPWLPKMPVEPEPMRTRVVQEYGNPISARIPTIQTYTLAAA